MTFYGVNFDFSILAPITVLVITGLIVLLVDLIGRSIPRVVLYGIGVAGCIGAFIALAPLYG
ncbi:MAG TPA: hypothetical protein VFF60_04165, partial [Candidatus Binatus sp.]|nr:hypothetical protein [Candidatus Binatus sp.]